MLRRFIASTLLVSACSGSGAPAPCSTGKAGAATPALANDARAVSPRPANPTDVASIDAILGALYGGVSGPPGPRDWDRVRSIFAPGAWVAPVEKRDGGAVAHIMNLDAFIARSSQNPSNTGFYEKEIARRTEAFGNIVHVFSTYEARHSEADPVPFRRGINSIQLLKDGDRYWVVSVYWDTEREGTPIPAQYLPR